MGHLISPQTPRGRDRRWLIAGEFDLFLSTTFVDFGSSFCAIGTILATDMGLHFEWVERFGRAMRDRRARYKQKQGRSADGSPDLVVNSRGPGAWVVVKQEEAPDQANDPNAPEPLSQEEADHEDRLFVCQALMKCADISNPVSFQRCMVAWCIFLLRLLTEIVSADLTIYRTTGLPYFWRNGLRRHC